MFEIPPYLVSISALILLIVIWKNKNRVDICLFSFMCVLQVITYLAFWLADMELTTKQFIVRSEVIFTNIILSIIVGSARRG
jgi:hypothetical protein